MTDISQRKQMSSICAFVCCCCLCRRSLGTCWYSGMLLVSQMKQASGQCEHVCVTRVYNTVPCVWLFTLKVFFYHLPATTQCRNVTTAKSLLQEVTIFFLFTQGSFTESRISPFTLAQLHMLHMPGDNHHSVQLSSCVMRLCSRAPQQCSSHKSSSVH